MSAESEGKGAAERFRRDHRLGVQPFGDLVAVIEQATGIDVAVLSAGPDEHGLTVRDPSRNAVFIGVATTRHPMRQRSTLAHELAHVLFEDWASPRPGQWSDRSPEEMRADAFARHLLLPLGGLRRSIGTDELVGLSALSTVVQRFLVSPAIAAIALQQAGYISAAKKAAWKMLRSPQLAARFGWLDHYRGLQAESGRRRAPQRLLTRATSGYQENVVSLQSIARLRGVDRETVAAEFRDAQILPKSATIAWADADDLPAVDVDLSSLDDLGSQADNE